MSRTRVVRTPNHLGDVVLAMPALAASDAALLVSRPGFAPLLKMGGVAAPVLALRRRRGAMLAAAFELRRRRFDEGILLTPSFSAALLFRLGGVRRTRGTDTDARGVLLHNRVPVSRIRGMHRSVAYHYLVFGELLEREPRPHIRVPEAERERWRDLTGPDDRAQIGIFPGSNASSRRWDAERFAVVVRAVAGAGYRPIVFGGPGERDLTSAVAGEIGFDAGGRTDLALLAAGLAACHILVTNDSGPMHLAAAVGTPTLSLWGAGNPAVTGVLGDGHTMLRREHLPCVPCGRNACPRSGKGTLLPDAERECLELIQVEDVLNALFPALAK